MAAEYEDIFNLDPVVDDTNFRNAFQKVAEYSGSDHPDKRLAAVLSLAEALSIVEGNVEDSRKVLHNLLQFAEDPEVAIRRTMTRQLNEITNYLREKPCFKSFLSDYILPTYQKLATDMDGEIRKGSHTSILSLVRHQNFTKEEIDKLLVQVKEMTEQNRSDDTSTDAIGLLTNLATMLDVATVHSALLSKFLNLCSDQAFSVRKACAVNFADMCASVSQKNLEKNLLPKFSSLCEDNVWGVRKACAESLVEISRHCSDDVRQKQLVPLLLGLLHDISRWVRSSAYQSLGPFIVTFAKVCTSSAETVKQEKGSDDTCSHQLILTSDVNVALDEVSGSSSSENVKNEDFKEMCHYEITGEAGSAITVSDFKDSDTRKEVPAGEDVVRKCPVEEAVIEDVEPQLNKDVLLSSTDFFSATGTVAPSSSISRSETNGGTDSVSANDFVRLDRPNDRMPNLEPVGSSDIVSNVVCENKVIDKTGILPTDITNATPLKYVEDNRIDTMPTDDVQVKEADNLSDKNENIWAPTDSDIVGDDAAVGHDVKILCSESAEKISNVDMTKDITATGEAVSDTVNSDRVTRTSGDMSVLSETVSVTVTPTDTTMETDDTTFKSDSGEISKTDKDPEIAAANKVDPILELQNRSEFDNQSNDKTSETGDKPNKQSGKCVEMENANKENDGRIADFMMDDLADHIHHIIASDVPDDHSNSSEVNNSSSVKTTSPAKPSRDMRLVHPASVSVVSQPGEEMTKNIGSMNVEVTDELNIVDGLVQPAENLVKINITRQVIVTLQQDTLEPEIPKTDDVIRRANVVHIPAETSPIRRPPLKKIPGTPRFGYPMPSMILPSADDSHETSGGRELSSLEIANRNLAANQSVVPCELLEQYLDMAEPSRAQTVDADILKHCAFSLPGVTKTLGQKNWACLRQLYQHLARNMQWQVRRTLALSIHEMASILGGDLITTELLPVFDELIKDLDEVRSGVIKNLSLFLQLLPERVRICYLPKLETFLVTETNTRWRYRQDFAQQLISLVGLFHPNDAYLHILPLAFVLVSDKVAEVRQTAVKLLSTILGMLSKKDNDSFIQVLEDLKKRLLCSSIWHQRQLFIFLSQSVHDSESIGFEEFLSLFLPSLLTLCKDSIPNVRITLARFLSLAVITHSDFFTSHENVHQRELLEALNALRKDPDSDVRYFVSPMTSRLLSIV